MSRSPRGMSPTQLALEMRARRTKRTVLLNLSMTAGLIVIAFGVWGYKSGWFSPAPKPEPTVSDVRADDPAPAPAAEAEVPFTPTKYPVKKLVFILDPTEATHAHMSKFFEDVLPSFSTKHQMDVLVLSPGGGFTSVTKGFVPITRDAGRSAAGAFVHSPEATGSSIKSAIGHAADEDATAVYLLTTAARARELGPDPVAALAAMTGGRKVVINCLSFIRPDESKADLKVLKDFSQASGGELMPEP
jgi:hypothetical protein